MTEPLSILNLGGHPKDAIMYAGGTMAKHVARGDRVTILTPTTGLSHHLQAIDDYRDSGDMPDMNALVAERKQELVDAAAELGVTDVRFLGYDDQIVLPREDMISDIADVIGEIQPNIIVTHWPYDTVPAHALTTQMTLLAIDAASSIRPGRPYAPSGGDTGSETAQIFYHVNLGRSNVLENLSIRVPTTVIDITDVVNQKSAAMNKFTSQHFGEDSPLERKRLQAAEGGTHATHARVAYAEAFVAHNPEVYEYLPVSEYRRKLGARSPSEKFDQMTYMHMG
jgi:LmbE family N-acetylglucosaminyl deacetylase